MVGKVSVLLVVMGFFVYLGNFESRSLAEKYGKRIYDLDQGRDRFAGFFEHWKWSYGDYRWFGKKAAVYVPDGGEVELEFHCRTPGLEVEPVVLKVSCDGRVLDEVVFPEDRGQRTDDGKQTTEYTVKRTYELPVKSGEEQELILEVSRTWIPHEVLGNFDRRRLGIGVKML